MFDILAQYLYEFKRLVLPTIGRFELENKGASTDLAASTIAAPSWAVSFKPYNAGAEVSDNSGLVNWLSDQKGISTGDAGKQLELFITDLEARLNSGELVTWPQLGILEKKNGQIHFEPVSANISPFTDVVVKKMSREHGSHQTLVGDRETTTAQIREQLQNPNERKRSGTVLMWVVLGFALIAIAWFFSQKGCNPSATGNQQKVESTPAGETYKIR